jgi:plasmid stabilization system protein ParE
MNEAKQVYWSGLAKDTYAELLKYLLDRFSPQIAIDFDEKVTDLTNRLRYFDQLCPPSKVVTNYHKCVINKQNSLIYRIVDDGIEIVTFVDNRSENLY